MRHSALPARTQPAWRPPCERPEPSSNGQHHPPQTAADERRRLARELHDGVIQEVLAAGLTIDWCLAEVPAGSPVHVRLQHAQQLTSSVLRQLRSSLLILREGAAKDEDLPAMLNGLMTSNAAQHLDLSVHVAGPPVPLQAAVRQALHRVASECLFNAAVHARACRAVVRLTYSTGLLALCVADDGQGEPETLQKIIRGEVPGIGGGYHIGLTDIAAAVAELGGRLAVTRSDLGGIAVEVQLSLSQRRNAGGGGCG